MTHTSRSPGAEGPRVASEKQLGGNGDSVSDVASGIGSVTNYSGVGGPPSALRYAPGLGDPSGISA
ncbi:hypothetical protein E4U56_005639, partial [Claviceps arundinis]